MLVSQLDYHLPPELIAQEVVQPRDSARLMHLHRRTGALQHLHVRDLPSLLRPDDLLVFNNTRVLRARLHGRKLTGARVEAVLLREIERNLWEVMLRPSARLKVGTPIEFASPGGEIMVRAQPEKRTESGWLLRFLGEDSFDIREVLPQLGEVPLPPYIHQSSPESDYQTIFARPEAPTGAALDSAAAPTAGLHFTPQLFEALQARGVQTAFVTLGVGIGTFRPIQTEVVEEHIMHAEEFEISAATAELINRQKERGGRVVAVGTTTVRTLESAANEQGHVQPGIQSTSIYITPGYKFRCVDALMTNFHLPRSTLLAMVATFCEQNVAQSTVDTPLTGLQTILYAYKQAIALRYRFFSFGDALFIE